MSFRMMPNLPRYRRNRTLEFKFSSRFDWFNLSELIDSGKFVAFANETRGVKKHSEIDFVSKKKAVSL